VLLAWLGFQALATTSSGFAATLGRPGVPPVPELAAAGVRRVSVGGGFAFAALGALVEAARELREGGTYTFWGWASIGSQAARSAFTA
jgi:2-methylisocitrate lyase-like PEP mutase family enzyme